MPGKDSSRHYVPFSFFVPPRGVATVEKVLTETDVDMSPWPTVKHFGSGLSFRPHSNITGDKLIKRRTF